MKAAQKDSKSKHGSKKKKNDVIRRNILKYIHSMLIEASQAKICPC